MCSLSNLQCFIWATHCNNLMQPAACLSQRTLHSKCLTCWDWPMWKRLCHCLISFTTKVLGNLWQVWVYQSELQSLPSAEFDYCVFVLCHCQRRWRVALPFTAAGMVPLQPLALHIWELSSVTGLQLSRSGALMKHAAVLVFVVMRSIAGASNEQTKASKPAPLCSQFWLWGFIYVTLFTRLCPQAIRFANLPWVPWLLGGR